VLIIVFKRTHHLGVTTSRGCGGSREPVL
jgi:hypothetical protein